MLKSLKLDNFRNHEKLELSLSDINVIVGPNGVGKSNILESVSLLSYCRSYREEDKKNLINFSSNFARVKGDNSEIFLQKDPYIMQIKDNHIIKRQVDIVGKLKSVVFSPEVINLLTNNPRNRRKFIDIAISQKDKEYLHALINYEKIRQERNSLLALIAERNINIDQLDFWDQELAKWGSVILEKRELAIQSIKTKLSSVYSEISDKEDDDLKIEYINTVKNNFLGELKSNRGREIAAKRTLIGPHRDDFVLKLNNSSINSFASRGEVKTAILSLKIAELEFLTNSSGNNENKKPLLLLDDVFSEFDEIRRDHLAKIINQYQTIITTTEESYLSKETLKKTNLIKLEK